MNIFKPPSYSSSHLLLYHRFQPQSPKIHTVNSLMYFLPVRPMPACM